MYLPDAEYADERRVTQIIMIINKLRLSLRPVTHGGGQPGDPRDHA